MINVKKGTAHSLQQSDIRGKAPAAGGVVAGMVCYLNTSGAIIKGAVPNGSTGIVGFAINDSVDGDVIESGKIALYQLDGNSIIETDQVSNTANSTNFPIGKAVYVEPATGLITTTAASNAGPIGWVEGIRNLQADGNVSSTQDYVSIYDSSGNVTGTQATVSNDVQKVQKNIPVVGVKLAAGNPTA
jgi:hypothetical protein